MADNDGEPARKRLKREKVSVYDAVAGRAGYEGFLKEPAPSKYRDTASTTTKAVPPEEVLYRRKGAPVRYEEDDVYSADRHLRPDQKLPDSDLVKAVHTYAANYWRTMPRQHLKDPLLRSMSATAGVAIGIMMEEVLLDLLGLTGHRALGEPDSEEDDDDDESDEEDNSEDDEESDEDGDSEVEDESEADDESEAGDEEDENELDGDSEEDDDEDGDENENAVEPRDKVARRLDFHHPVRPQFFPEDSSDVEEGLE